MDNRQLLKSVLGLTDMVGDSIHEILANNSSAIEVENFKELSKRYTREKAKSVEGKSFRNSAEIYDDLKYKYYEIKQEIFSVLLLDNKHRIIKELKISQGILNKSLVHPREVFAEAIQYRAAAVILMHNHPSGDPSPSTADITITKRLVQVGEIVGINVLDHIIVCDSSYYSFVDEDRMPNGS